MLPHVLIDPIAPITIMGPANNNTYFRVKEREVGMSSGSGNRRVERLQISEMDNNDDVMIDYK